MANNDTKPLSNEILDQLLAGRDPKTVPQADGLMGELKKALAERMLNAEMDVHLANEAEAGIPNRRNGSSPKTVLTPDGELTLSIPRDRHGRFDPTLIAKYRRRFPGFDDKIAVAELFLHGTRERQRLVGITLTNRKGYVSVLRLYDTLHNHVDVNAFSRQFAKHRRQAMSLERHSNQSHAGYFPLKCDACNYTLLL